MLGAGTRLAKGIATLAPKLKGIQTWAKPIKSFDEYKPFFNQKEKEIDALVSNRKNIKTTSYQNSTRPENLNKSFTKAKDIIKTLSETPAHTLKRSEALKEYTPKGIMELVDKQTPDGKFFFPNDVAQELKNYSLAKRQKLWMQEDLIENVNKKFQEPWNYKKGPMFDDYKDKVTPEGLRSMLNKIEPALDENVLKNLQHYKKTTKYGKGKMDYVLDDLHNLLEGKLITGKNLTRDQELHNLEAFKKAFHEGLGYSGRKGPRRGKSSEYMKTYLEEYANKNNMPELVSAMKVKSKFTGDIPILNLQKTPVANRFDSRVTSGVIRSKEEYLNAIVKQFSPAAQQEFNKAKSLKKFFPGAKRGVVEVDHILPIMFGGSGKDIDNLTILLQGSHRGPNYTKSGFEKAIHRIMTPYVSNWGQRNTGNIIDAVNNNDMQLARKLVSKIHARIKAAKEENLYRFKLG